MLAIIKCTEADMADGVDRECVQYKTRIAMRNNGADITNSVMISAEDDSNTVMYNVLNRVVRNHAKTVMHMHEEIKPLLDVLFSSTFCAANGLIGKHLAVMSEALVSIGHVNEHMVAYAVALDEMFEEKKHCLREQGDPQWEKCQPLKLAPYFEARVKLSHFRDHIAKTIDEILKQVCMLAEVGDSKPDVL
jgi:hypothetical protein